MTGQGGEEATDGPVLPQLQTVARISKIPIVESALGVASGIYDTVKESNSVYSWTLNRAEDVGTAALASIASRFENPIHAVDNILGKGMDIVEEAVPAIKLTPKQMLDNTRQLVANGLGLNSAQPDATVTSRIVGVAVTGLSSAVTVVETYANKYLPTEEEDSEQETIGDNQAQVPKEQSFQVLVRLWKISRRMQRACVSSLKSQFGPVLGRMTENVIGTKMTERVWFTFSEISQIVSSKDIPLTDMASKVVYQISSLGIETIGDITTVIGSLLPGRVVSKIQITEKETTEEQQQQAVNGCDSDERAKVLLGRQDKGTSPTPAETAVKSENNSIIIPDNKSVSAQVKASAAQGKTKAEAANVLHTINEKDKIANV